MSDVINIQDSKSLNKGSFAEYNKRKSEIIESIRDLKKKITLCHNEYYGSPQRIIDQLTEIEIAISGYFRCEKSLDNRLKAVEMLVREHSVEIDEIKNNRST